MSYVVLCVPGPQEIHEIEERKNSHINELMKKHERAFAEIKNYYNDITHNNLDLIKTLKEDVAEMKKREAQVGLFFLGGGGACFGYVGVPVLGGVKVFEGPVLAAPCLRLFAARAALLFGCSPPSSLYRPPLPCWPACAALLPNRTAHKTVDCPLV